MFEVGKIYFNVSEDVKNCNIVQKINSNIVKYYILKSFLFLNI